MKTAEIQIPVNGETNIKANLNIPYDPVGLVIFSHGSGSSRFSSRNLFIAEFLNRQGIATLLTDLLTELEDTVVSNRFNIKLLSERLTKVTNEVVKRSDLKNLPVGFFGASTGSASAFIASTQVNCKIHAIVSRGGRPDLAGEILSTMEAPTLLIVGGLDPEVIALNRDAYSKMNCIRDIHIVNGATHLFEESGKLNEVAELALAWFGKYFVSSS